MFEPAQVNLTDNNEVLIVDKEQEKKPEKEKEPVSLILHYRGEKPINIEVVDEAPLDLELRDLKQMVALEPNKPKTLKKPNHLPLTI